MFKALLIVSICSTFSLISAQDVYYYGSNGKPLSSAEGAVVKKELKTKSDSRMELVTSKLGYKGWKKVLREKIRQDPDGLEMVIKLKGDQWIPSTIYRTFKPSAPGLYHFEDRNTKNLLMREGTSSSKVPLHLHGTEHIYGKGKQLLSISEYSDNQLLSNQNWLMDGSRYVDSIFYSVDQEPAYIPGDAFFNAYVLNGLNTSGFDLSNVDDVVVVGWVVMEDGTIDGVLASKGKSLQLNTLICEIIASLPGAWEPARLDGREVRYYMSIPLNFINNSASFQELEFSSGMMHYNKY